MGGGAVEVVFNHGGGQRRFDRSLAEGGWWYRPLVLGSWTVIIRYSWIDQGSFSQTRLRGGENESASGDEVGFDAVVIDKEMDSPLRFVSLRSVYL